MAGTGIVERLDDKVKNTSVALGKALAKAGYGLVTGGWPGVDELTARSFAADLEQLGLRGGVPRTGYSLGPGRVCICWRGWPVDRWR